MAEERMTFDFKSKREEILSEFSEKFKTEMIIDPGFNMVYNYLLRDVSPYIIIEQLLIDRKDLLSKLRHL